MNSDPVKYIRGANLEAWVANYTGLDVILRLAHRWEEVSDDGEVIEEVVDFDQVVEETGRLVGVIDNRIYLDYPTGPTSMPIPWVVEAIQRRIKDRGGPTYGVMTCGGFVAAPLPHDVSLVMEIEVDDAGVGRERQAAQGKESAKVFAYLQQIVATEPCALCGKMVQRGESYDVVGPDSAWGEEGASNYVPEAPTYRVICHDHV